MSRIGRMPIEIPKGVDIKVDGSEISIKGPKGKLDKKLHPDMLIKIEDGAVVVERPSDQKQHKALHGLTRSLVANMIKGVTDGFSRDLEIQGTGYRAQKQGNTLVLTVGYSHPVEIKTTDGIEFDVPAPTKISVKGIDKELVGQIAANIRNVRPPEPYKGKGIRYAGEYVRIKPGKTGKA